MAKVTDLKVRSKEYWEDRFIELADRNGKKGDRNQVQIRKLFKASSDEMADNIQTFYAKYGIIDAAPTFKTLGDGSTVVSGINSKLVVPQNVAGKALTKGTRLTALQGQLDAILKTTAGKQNEIMKATLSGVVQDQYYETFYEIHRGVGIGQSFNLLTEPQVQSLIRHEVAGADFVERVGVNNEKLATVVNQTLKEGITQGLSNNEMVKRINKKMNLGTVVANTLLRTEVTNSLNQASLIGYERSGIVDKYEYLATLDNRTSDICTDLDGKIFLVKNATTGLNFPPMHPN